jgi:hypothetical protein
MSDNLRFTIIWGVDEKQMEVTFPSIFVQGIDAHIVHYLLDKVNEVNTKLRESNLPELLVEMNHDCFGFSLLHAHYQTRMVQQHKQLTLVY